jgi:hypothetical protein
MRAHFRVAVLTVALIGQGAVALPATADEHPRVETIATGLNNPRGIDVAPDGTVYVAEAGEGGDDFCVEIEEGEESFELCFGDSSTVRAIAPDGTRSVAVGGLPSFMFGEGEYIGASDVSVAGDGSLYVSVGLGADSGTRDDIAAGFAPAGMLGTIQHAAGESLTMLADLAAWETENDPNEGQPSTQGPMGAPSDDSNPNAVLVASDGAIYAVDAGGNTVLEIDPDSGDIELRAFLADRMADAPPFLGLPPGTQIPMQAVPTQLAEAPNGNIVIGQLTGFPFPVGGANVYRLRDDNVTPALVAEGFTNIIDVAYLDGELYVLEIAHESLFAGFGGALVRVRADGTRATLLRDVLVAPGGVAVGPDGLLYITNTSVGDPGTGSVLRFDPSMAADPAIQSACPPLQVPGAALSDISGTVHEEAITCAAWHGLFTGFADGTFGPNGNINRGQFASTIARLIRATGTTLPTGASGQFDDVDGTTHAAAINDLAAAGLVSGFTDGSYRPGASLTRAQAVTILVGAYGFVTDSPPPAGPDAFTDDDGSVHEANINAAAAMGWVRGTSADTFAPGANIRRGQMASVLTRVASDLIDDDHLQLPS